MFVIDYWDILFYYFSEKLKKLFNLKRFKNFICQLLNKKLRQPKLFPPGNLAQKKAASKFLGQAKFRFN